ncbi:MAG: phosphoglycerate kinase [Nanoarchaeota archaeon]
MKRFTLENFPLENKTVFLRVDYNVPLEKEKVVDDNKIRSSLPTIRYLLQKNCKIVLATHLGNPAGKVDAKLKVNPLFSRLQELLSKEKKWNIIQFIKLNDCIGKEIKAKIAESKPKTIFMLENLRFYREEETNDVFFAHSLAQLAEVYVNDAFAVSHRKHASVDAITKYLPSLPGLLLETEIQQLSLALNPKKPAIWIMGGAKLNKIDLIKQALKKADYLLIGGALAFSFLRAKGINMGLSKLDPESVKIAAKILKSEAAKKIILPVDFVAAADFSPHAQTEIVKYNHLQDQQTALDLGPETVSLFKQYLRKAHTIVWNGPLGYFEWAKFAHSTKEIGRFLGKLTATAICGGGETVEAVRKFRLEHYFTHVSTGGGAALMFLSGQELPGITALENNYQKFKRKFR